MGSLASSRTFSQLRALRLATVASLGTLLAAAPGCSAPGDARSGEAQSDLGTPVFPNNCRVFVATNGLDTNPGTKAHPFATLERARDAVRALVPTATAPIEVCLRGGRYELTKPFTLGPADSGTAAAPITYRSYPAEFVRLTGSRVLHPRWTPYDANIYQAPVDGSFNQLFVNLRRATRARSPNGDASYHLAPVSQPSLLTTQFLYQPGSLPAGLGESDAEIVSMTRWMSPRERIASTDATTVTVEGFPWNTEAYGSYLGVYGSDYGGNDRYYVENTLAALDSPGEWYLDQKAHVLYYWPSDPTELAGYFEAPHLRQLVRAGTYPANAGFMRTQSLTVPYCRHIGVYPSSDALSFGAQSFTVATWMNLPSGAVDASWLFTKGEPLGPHASGAPGSGYGLSASGTGATVPVQFVVGDGAGHVTASAGAQPRGQWTHVAFVVDRVAQTLSAYANGVLTDTQSLSTLGSIANGLPLDVGAYTNAACSNGAAGDFRVYASALSATDVGAIVAGSAPAQNLALWLPFDGDYDDHSPNASETIPFFPPAFAAGPTGGRAADFSTSYPSDVSGAVDYVGFHGLSFEGADWVMPFTGYPGNTPLWASPPALYLHAHHATVTRNHFAHLGSHAIAGMLASSTIADNAFWDLGADAIKIGQLDTTAADQLALAEFSSNDTITGNYISDVGIVDRDAYAISITDGENNVISRNTIENAPGYGIAEGSGAGSAMIALGNNRVSLNRIDHVMQLINDGSAIYLTGTQPGTLIDHNVIHDVVVTPAHLFDYLIFGIYLDGTANSFTVRDNLTYRTQGSGILLNAASSGNANNLVTNNVFVNGVDGQVFLNYASSDTFRGNVVYYAGEPNSTLFPVSAAGAIGASDDNLFYSPDAPNFASQLAAWRALGYDGSSVVADPQFVDAAHDDYTLQASSPALAPIGSGGIGFQPIDFSGLP